MKIFISSTAYDLIDFREKMKQIIKELGHEYIAHEDNFPIRPNLHSHDQCLEAVKDADVVVCILDKRYGGKYSGTSNNISDVKVSIKGKDKIVEKKDLSITWCELITANQNGKYIFTFARDKLLDEKNIRRHNQDFVDFEAFYADDESLYDLVDWITKLKKNNWINPFHSIVDFEIYFRKWIKEISKNIYRGKSIETNSETVVENQDHAVFVVEGESDRRFILSLLQMINSKVKADFIVTYGKYRMIYNLDESISNFSSDLNFLFILFDKDEDDDNKIVEDIEKIKANIPKNIKTEIIAIDKNLEDWIKCGVTENLDKKELKHLDLLKKFNLSDARNKNQQLDDFVKKIESL